MKNKSASEIVQIMLEHPLEETADLIIKLMKEIEEMTPPRKITLTPDQFERHFQLSQESGRRGRPVGSFKNALDSDEK